MGLLPAGLEEGGGAEACCAAEDEGAGTFFVAEFSCDFFY